MSSGSNTNNVSQRYDPMIQIAVNKAKKQDARQELRRKAKHDGFREKEEDVSFKRRLMQQLRSGLTVVDDLKVSKKKGGNGSGAKNPTTQDKTGVEAAESAPSEAPVTVEVCEEVKINNRPKKKGVKQTAAPTCEFHQRSVMPVKGCRQCLLAMRVETLEERNNALELRVMKLQAALQEAQKKLGQQAAGKERNA